MPCAEQVRFTSSGSEATFFALRIARAFTKKDKILKFEGGFHGTHDYSLMSVGPRSPKAFPAPTPDSAGIPHAIQDSVLVAPFNDLADIDRTVAPFQATGLDLGQVEDVVDERRQPLALGDHDRRHGQAGPGVRWAGGDDGDR